MSEHAKEITNLFKKQVEDLANSSTPKLDPKKTVLLIVEITLDSNEPGGLFDQMGFDIRLLKEAVPNTVSLVNACREKGIPVLAIQEVYNDNYIHKVQYERFKAMGFSGDDICPKGKDEAKVHPKILEAGIDLTVIQCNFTCFSRGKAFAYKPGNKELESYMELPESEDARLKSEGKKTMFDYFEESKEDHEDVDAHLSGGGVVNIDNYLEKKGIDTLILTGGSLHVCVDVIASGAMERGLRVVLPLGAFASESPSEEEDYIRHYVHTATVSMFRGELTTTERLVDVISKT